MKIESLKKIIAPMLCLFLALASCSSDDSSGGPDGPELEKLVLSTSNSTIVINESVTFEVTLDGKEISDATIYIDGIAINSNSHTFTEKGIFTVIAKKAETEDSNIVKITVVENLDAINDAKKFKHRTLVEDFTGAWCQYCPLVAYDIEMLENSDPEKFQAIAIHNEDPFDFNKSVRRKFEAELGLDGYPFALTDRVVDFRQSPNSPTTRHKDFSNIGAKISSNLGELSGSAIISLKFGTNFTQALNYAVFILEDGLIYEQVNTTQYYKDSPYIYIYPKTTNFVHNNTLRALYGGFRGETIPAEYTVEGGEFTSSPMIFNYKSEDITKLKVVVIVTDVQSGEVLNTIVAKGNTDQNYQVIL